MHCCHPYRWDCCWACFRYQDPTAADAGKNSGGGIMTDIAPTTAAEINRHHRLAREHADAAIQHAITAGRLLLEVKTQLMHGEWTAWLAANVSVSERQAQRYMRAASGKPLIRSNRKSDTMSDLPDPVARASAIVNGRTWVQLVLPILRGDLC